MAEVRTSNRVRALAAKRSAAGPRGRRLVAVRQRRAGQTKGWSVDPVSSVAVDAAGSTAHGWRDAAACLEEDPELFFPEGESDRYRSQITAALQVCATCEVVDRCLRYALEADQRTGIWGGTTARTRRGLEVIAGQVRPIRRGRTAAAVAAAAIAAPAVPAEHVEAAPDLQRSVG